MDGNMKRTFILPVAILVLAAAICPGSEEALEEEKPAEPVIDLKVHEVRIKATVCLARGILEFVTVVKGGREHEAVFSTTCRPSNLHMALLAIGMEPYALGGTSEMYQDGLKSRSRLRFEVEFEEDGRTRRIGVDKLLFNRETDSGAVEDAWVFTGSYFTEHDGKSVYVGDYSDVVMAVIPDRAAVIQLAVKTGNPYDGEDLGLEVNTEEIASVGTKVTLIFSPWHREKAKD